LGTRGHNPSLISKSHASTTTCGRSSWSITTDSPGSILLVYASNNGTFEICHQAIGHTFRPELIPIKIPVSQEETMALGKRLDPQIPLNPEEATVAVGCHQDSKIHGNMGCRKAIQESAMLQFKVRGKNWVSEIRAYMNQ
jgi:hypothetical protein